MMESEMPPPASPPHVADDPEVSSRRVSSDPQRPEVNSSATRSPEYSAPRESNKKSLGLSGVQPDTLMGLLEQAAISEAHRTLMGTVVERISSAKNGLNEAFTSLLRGFEAAEGPAVGRTAGFAELKRQLDMADANIVLVNKHLDEAHGMYFWML
ncbi:uncharacterized protein [Triticum aestivum]|uniref:uncharacterized protein n=1 Tax=Triticum aestivum TaxID=4565 RepID=UPI001D02303B|nr:uncharacterized protein LOC123039074 [Triticum aestivum]